MKETYCLLEECQHGGEFHYFDSPMLFKVRPASMVPIRPQPTVGIFPPQHALHANEVVSVSAMVKDRHENYFMRLASEPGWIGPDEDHAIVEYDPDDVETRNDVSAGTMVQQALHRFFLPWLIRKSLNLNKLAA